MGRVERKEREKLELQQLIIKTAENIITKEGIEKLSVRKIADKIEYSPAIIYHYFKDKDDIVNQVFTVQYQKIIAALSETEITAKTPVERLKQISGNYIKTALEMSDSYLSAQLSTSPEILKYTAFMYRGAAQNKPALAILCNCLREMRVSGKPPELSAAEHCDDELELTAQMIVASTFGLVIKLIVEKDIDSGHKGRLIDEFVNVTLPRIAGVS
ncbi:MAG: TetR/AcrR family transcriptional regulator [Clostridiales bacterium]|nr:TetR/AcrR family transcriptional regulator [Clostridiales bacterium]